MSVCNFNYSVVQNYYWILFYVYISFGIVSYRIVSQSCPTQRNVNKIPEYNLPCHFIQMCVWYGFVHTNTIHEPIQCSIFAISRFAVCCLIGLALFGLRSSFTSEIIYKYIMWALFFFCLPFVSFAHTHTHRERETRWCSFFLYWICDLWQANWMHATIQTFVSVSAFYFVQRFIFTSYSFFLCMLLVERHLDIMNREHCLLVVILVLLLLSLLLLLWCSHLDYT